MATGLPVILTWFPQSEHPHYGIPSHCQAVLEEHFKILWVKDLIANPKLGYDVRVAFGASTGNPVIQTVQDNLQWFPNLKVLITCSTAYSHINLAHLKQHGIRASNTVTFSGATAEHALLLLLATARDLLKNVEEVRHGVEVAGGLANPAPGLSGATLGIIGLGRIGLKVARSARILDARVLYHKRNARESNMDKDDGFEYVPSLNTLLNQSDYVLIACPLSQETQGLLGGEEFKQMKPTAALINVARAAIIDNEALVRALQSGELRSAALDVTDPPILPTDHPLLSLPNVIVTSHCGYCTQRAMKQIFHEIVHNALEGLAGRPMPNEITPGQ